MELSTATLVCKANTHIEVLRKCSTEGCVKCYNEEWLVGAVQVLKKSPFSCLRISTKKCFHRVGVKTEKRMIVGPANCIKPFLFKPLQAKLEVFSNPSDYWYAWIGAEEVEIIFLNFRWTSEMIA